jgi:hypothetical protein
LELFLLMAKVQSSKFEVEKFSGKNSFALWKLKMRDLLVQQGLQKALAGRSKKLTSMTDEDWEDLDARALSTIRMCLADEVLFNIAEETTTTGLWTKLESLYMTKNLSNIIFLKRQLYSLRMKEGTKIVDHLNVFNTLISQLTAMEVKFDDEDKAITLLCSFPESWDHMVTTVWFNTTDAIDYDIVVGALLCEEMRKKSNKEKSTSSNGGQRTIYRKRDKVRGVHQGLSQRARRVRKNVGFVANLGISRRIVGKDRMQPRRTPQKNYQSIDDGVVFMKNVFSCKIVGVGSVRIRMHDGSVRTLTDVRHVPELRKNLISLGVLDSVGYKCTTQGGVLKVSKDILVVMKEKRIGNLYQLEGRT